ncbi:hypothetical protein FOZ62_024684 [Perkinsus olseni]|uniref:C3H1-type domain-containing protein n=1 Tax=Perkinsus olseni TaxID=32597 RepID=A0A7J6TPH7_PEROL|nr:hypothetical protein FOZ62_024684 [Perkinsus olseni]
MADKCQYLHVHKKIDTPVCKSFEKIGFCEKGSACEKLHYTAPIRQLKREASDDSADSSQQTAEGNPKKRAKGLSKAEIERKLDEECIRAWEAGKLMKMYD